MVVFDEATGRQYRLGMPGTQLDPPEWKACLDALQNIRDVSFIVVSGSLPPGVPLSVFTDLAGIARKMNAALVADCSGEALQYAAAAGVFLIKPNLHELSSLAGLSTIDPQQADTVARNIIREKQCTMIAVSMAAAGALLVTETASFRAAAPAVSVKSTVGAGDSMLAGLVYSISRGLPLQQCLDYAVACGTAATLNPGTALFNTADVERLFQLIAGSRNTAGQPE